MKLPLCDCGVEVHPGEDQCAGCSGIAYSFEEFEELFSVAYDSVLDYTDKDWLKKLYPAGVDVLDLHTMTENWYGDTEQDRAAVAAWLRKSLEATQAELHRMSVLKAKWELKLTQTIHGRV